MLGKQVFPVDCAGIGEDARWTPDSLQPGNHRQHADVQREHVAGGVSKGFGVGGGVRAARKLAVEFRPINVPPFQRFLQPAGRSDGADRDGVDACQIGHLLPRFGVIEPNDDIAKVEIDKLRTHREGRLSMG